MFCKNCGNRLEESHKFCPFCGVAISSDGSVENVACAETTSAEEVYAETIATETLCGEPAPKPQKAKLNAGMLVWSIINMALAEWLPVFGIIGLVMTIQAANTTVELSAGKLKIAKIMNILGTVLAALIQVGGFFLGLFLASQGYTDFWEYLAA